MAHESELQSLEIALTVNTTRRDSGRVRSLLAEDFREFGSSGCIYTKADMIDHLLDESPVGISLSDFEETEISPEVVLLTYRSIREVLGGASVHALRSSLWVRRDDRWQMLFHQGTRVDPSPAGDNP